MKAGAALYSAELRHVMSQSDRRCAFFLCLSPKSYSMRSSPTADSCVSRVYRSNLEPEADDFSSFSASTCRRHRQGRAGRRRRHRWRQVGENIFLDHDELVRIRELQEHDIAS